MNVVCTPPALLDQYPDADIRIAMHAPSSDSSTGEVGGTMHTQLRQNGVVPISRSWDLLSIALAVIAADVSCLRVQSSDGWTRQIKLIVSVGEPEFWSGQTELLIRMLCFLTGDIWDLQFVGGNPLPTKFENVTGRFPQSSVCLLSGGVDSLVGMLDLVSTGRIPLLASQVSAGDKTHQQEFASCAGDTSKHIQLNHNVRSSGTSELSQRARSLGFIAYGVVAATSLSSYVTGSVVDLYVPENGFISINVPLTPLRLGTFSTRTTHPAYIKMFQCLLDAADLHVRLINPYQFKTKGEMLAECRDQDKLLQHVFNSTSCGRFARMGFRHCGRCIPCLVRRAAFQSWGQDDRTEYKFGYLSIRDPAHAEFDDVRSLAMAIERVRLVGVEKWAGSSLNWRLLGDIDGYISLLRRAMRELEVFLQAQGVL